MCLGVPGRVLEVVDGLHLATVEVAGVRRAVNVGLLADGGESLQRGDWVLVHVGFALNRLDEAEAAATLELLAQIGRAGPEELLDDPAP